MADKSSHSSDMGAAFAGLIGGAVFIGVILYVIVLLTNRQFEGHSKAGVTIPPAAAAIVA